MLSGGHGWVSAASAVLLVCAIAGSAGAAGFEDEPGVEEPARPASARSSLSASASAAAAQGGNETTVDASHGGVTISSGVNSLSIGARMQFRWTVDDRELFSADSAGSGVDRPDGVFSQFDVPRMRVTLSGGVYQPWMRYVFQFDFSRTNGDGASKIKDAIFEIRPTGRSYRIMMGQFKVPFSMQQLTSSGRQQFVDRSITDDKFAPGRDTGVMLAGRLGARKVGYEIGAFNGSGESIQQNNESHLWAGRLYVHPLGSYSLSEGASDASDRAVLHVGVGARGGKQIRGRTAAGVIEDPDNQTAFNIEFALKAPRFSSTAEYYWMTDEQDNPVVGPDIDARGYHAQAGYMLVPPSVEVGIRYARIDGDTRADDATLSEVRGVVGYYWRSHNLKVQADAGQLRYDSGYGRLPAKARSGLPGLGSRLVAGQSLSDTQFRVQLQVAF